MMICGIDPGVSGALVVMDTQKRVHGWCMMPTTQDNTKTTVDPESLTLFLVDHKVEKVFLESVGARPGQGVVSMFSFGRSLGAVEGVCGALGIPATLVLPQVWKRHSGALRASKDYPRIRAAQTYPEIDVLQQKIKGQALGDAIGIATWGVDQWQQM